MKRWLFSGGWGASAIIAGVVHAAVAFVVVEPGRAPPSDLPVRLSLVASLPQPEVPPEPPPEPPPELPPPMTQPPRKEISPVAPVEQVSPVETTDASEEPMGTEPLLSDNPPIAQEPRSASPPVATPPPARAAGDLLGYGRALRQRLLSQRRYPPMAERLELEGRAQVRVVVRRDGSLAGMPILEKSTGHELLDQEARRMASAAAPYSPLPSDHPHETAVFVVPVRFAVPR